MCKMTPTSIRKEIIQMGYAAKASHLGSALSLVEILYCLYDKYCNLDASNLNNSHRDKIILSKGHGSAALYAVLHQKGIITDEAISRYSINDGILPCHIDMTSAPGLEASAGSLGHGMGIAVGLAIANKLKKINSQVIAIIGDGESQEGSIWEAAELASTFKLQNFTVIVDYNKFQASGETNKIINLSNLSERFRSFGFLAVDVDGHSVEQILDALKTPSVNKPKAIIAHTIKGKGISFLENTLASHYTKLNDELFNIALSELVEE